MSRVFAVGLIVAFALLCNLADARQGTPPYSIGNSAKRGTALPLVELPAIDRTRLQLPLDDATRLPGAMHDKRLAIAIGNEVAIDPQHDGDWQTLPDAAQLWRVQVRVSGATDLHLGFGVYDIPRGAELWVIGAFDYYEGPYTADDAGPLWVPVVPGNTATIELRLPAGIDLPPSSLLLSHVGGGFRDLFRLAKATGPGTSGACNINVVCPLGVPYSAEERALAYYEFAAADGFTYICTGTLLADVPADRRNYVLTAAHCVSTANEARSMRLYWNYRSSECTRTTGYSFAQNQTGATLRATRADADFALVELNTNPDPAWRLFHAGWDASGNAPSSSIGLHHPNGDVAKVTESRIAPRNYDNCIDTGGGSRNTHWLSGPYSQGTTEGGSSGSGLWIPANDASNRGRRLIGVLSGGNAECVGTSPDNGYDCYGKLSVAFDGASAAQRLRDWLDPAGTGIRTVAGIENVAPAASTDPLLVTRDAAEQQARGGRTATRGVGAHRPGITPRSGNIQP